MIVRFSALALATLVLAAPVNAQDGADDLIADALSAAPAMITDGATVMDWEGNELRAGNNGWVCMPTPPAMLTGEGSASMCLDGAWLNWAQAWMGKTEPAIDRVGIAYMLAGDTGASNTDPYAAGPDAVDDWVDAGPHIMVLVPDAASLDALPTDPAAGAWVMWKDTPYAHIMIPTEGIKSSEMD